MKNNADDIATLEIRSEPSELAAVRDCVREKSIAIGFNDAEVGKIMLAVDEALANVIRHGYGGPCAKPIHIRIEQISKDGVPWLCFTIRDFGKQVSPEKIVGRPLEDVRPGGLGVHIIRSVMDEVDYTTADGGGMQLTMRKKKTP